MFNLEFLQAINDWQIGGAILKATRAEKLKELGASLPAQFRSVTTQCYRRIDLPPSALRQLGTALKLPEKISSWSTSRSVAWTLHGGIPEKDERLFPYVFAVTPTPDSIILNIEALYADRDFLAAISHHCNSIANFSDGIGRWGDTEHEVLLEIDSVPLNSVNSQGGYSSSAPTLDQYLRLVMTAIGGRPPNDQEFEVLREQCRQAGIYDGKQWLDSPDAIFRLQGALVHHANK